MRLDRIRSIRILLVAHLHRKAHTHAHIYRSQSIGGTFQLNLLQMHFDRTLFTRMQS